MAYEHFLDTNILVYPFDPRDPRKQRVALDTVKAARLSKQGCISHQVVQEFLNVVTRKSAVVIDAAGVASYLGGVLMPLMQVVPNEALFRAALAVQARWQFGFYDSLIVTAALQAGCKRLLTEDMQHGQIIDGLRIENPFLAT